MIDEGFIESVMSGYDTGTSGQAGEVTVESVLASCEKIRDMQTRLPIYASEYLVHDYLTRPVPWWARFIRPVRRWWIKKYTEPTPYGVMVGGTGPKPQCLIVHTSMYDFVNRMTGRNGFEIMEGDGDDSQE